ncbi:uncharacterized protein LOC118763570 [Octopus sinensis]|uniref:Uncharacterized protein LOC118763570 n=1 Tax=Octopus sinensis TaxID=2607531 RepID=A0A7E6EVS4_9MOLL|nr:uncharacterized protein LOC118763570 [Octopus sinensis]
MFSVTQKKMFKSSLPVSVSNLEGTDNKWLYPSTDNGDAIRNVSTEEKQGKHFVDVGVPLTSSHPSQFQNISRTSDAIDTDGSRFKEISNITEETESQRNQSSLFDRISFEPTLSDLDDTSVKVKKYNTHQRLVTFGKEDHQVSQHGSSELGGISRSDFNSSQKYEDPTFHGEMVQVDDANATEIPQLTSANDFLVYDENSYDLLPEESLGDEKNSSENLDEVHDDRMNTSVHVEGTVEKWGRGGHSIKPTTSLSDDKNMDDIAKKDTENDPLKPQPSYIDEGEHLLAEIELGESFPQSEDKKIPHTPEEEYREHQHHMGASPINRDIHQLHQILPDILVEEPDISHKPTVFQTTTALKDTEKHVKISETVKKETVPAIDIDKQVFFKGSDIDKEKKRIAGRTEASKLDFFEHDSFLKPETLMMETTEETQTDAKDSPSTNIIEQEVTGERTEENILQTAESKIPPTDLGFKTKEDPFDSHKKSTHGVRSEIPSLGFNTKFITNEGSALPTITAGLQESQSSFLHPSNSVPKIETQDVPGKLITEQGEKTSKESYTGTTRDIKADPDMKTLGLLQPRKEVKTFNKTSGLQDKLDIVKSDTTLFGIEELRIHEYKPQSTLQGSDKSQSQHHQHLDGILQSTDKSRSRQPTTKVGTLQSGKPFETDVTIKDSGKLKEYKAPAKYVTLQGRQTSMKSESTVMDGTAHDIDRSRSPKTIQIDDSLYSSGNKLHGYESSTQLHDTYEHKATHVRDSTSFSREKSKKFETTLLDSISQAAEEKRLPSLSHLDGASLGADISKIYVEPTQAVSTLRDTSQLHEVSDGRGDSRGHTPIQVNHTMQHIEELRGQQPTQLYGTLPDEDEHKHTPVQLDDTLLGIDESHKHELSHVDSTSPGPEKEIFHETKQHNTSHSIDEVRRHEMIKLQNISYDIGESKRNESTLVLNESRSIDELKEHKPIQLNTTLDSTDISHRLEPSLLDSTSHGTSEFYRQESTIVDDALHGMRKSKEYEPTQVDGTLNVGTSKLNEYEPTIDGTLHDTSELYKHNQSQLYSTSHGTDASKRQEPVQLEGTVNIGSDEQGEYETTQRSGTSHDTGRLINNKSSLLDGISDGFNKSHVQELIQIDGISYDTGDLHGHTLSKLDGTIRDTGELYGHRPTELASTLHGHKPTQTDDISHITKGLSEQEASLLDSSTYSTGELNTHGPTQSEGIPSHSIDGLQSISGLQLSQLDRRRQDTDDLPGYKPSSPDSTPYSIDGLHGYESSQVDGISYRIKESTSHKLTQANGSLHNVTESRNHSKPQQYDTWHSLNKYETTQSDGNRQHGEATKTDDSIKLTSYQIPKRTGVSLESDGSSRQHATLHVTDDNLQDSESNVMGDSSHVTDKMKSHRPSEFDHTVSSSDKSRINQSANQYISLDDTDKSKTLDNAWRRTDELGIFQTPKTDIIYQSTERPKSYEPVKTYDLLHGSTNVDGTLQDADILSSYDPSRPDASSHSTDKEGVYVSKTDEASHGTDKIISYDPTKIFGTSHDADRIKSSYTMQVDDTPRHTSKYIDRIKSYDPTKVSDGFQVSVKSKFSEPTKTGSSIAESVLDKHTPTTYSKSGDGILRESSGYEFLHPGYRTTIKSNGKSWIKAPSLDNGFRKEIQDTDHQISAGTLYQTSFTNKHFDRDGMKISATTQIKGEKAVKYGDVGKKVDRGEPKFVSSTSEPSKDGKVLSLDGETQRKTGENYVDSHKMPVDMPGGKTETSTDATLKLVHDTSLSSSGGRVSKTKETGKHSASELTHAYPSLVTRSPVDKQKTEKDLAINASAKRTDDLSSVIFTDSITKERLSTKSEDFPKENVMDSFSSLKPKVSSSRTSAQHQTFSGISSILDKKQDQNQLKTLLDLPSTLLFGQLMDVGLTSKGSHPESQDTHSSIEVDVDRTEHFHGFDALRQLTGSAPKEKEKIVTEIASDLFQTKHQDMKPFIEKKIPTVKTPTVKSKQSVDKSRFSGLKNVSPRHPGKSNESIFSDFDTESDQIPIQHTITMTPHTKAKGSATDIDHKSKSPERDDSKLQKITQPYSVKVEPGLETDLIDEGIPLPEYTSFINYQDSIDPGASTSEVPIHILSTFNKSFTKTDESEKSFPETLHSNIPSYETPVLDFTEDDRKIPMDRTTPNAYLDILSSKKQRFHASYSPDQYQEPTKTGRPFATTGYPSMIEHFDRNDIMKFHIPGDTTISTHPESILPHTPKTPTGKTTQFRKGTPGITNNMKSLRQQSDRFLQIVTPSTTRSDIKNIWEDNSNLMLNLYETARFTKASFLRKNESAYYLVESVDNVARSLKLKLLERETCICYFTKQTVEVSCKQEMIGRIVKLTLPSKERDLNIMCSVKTYDDSWKGYESCLEGHKYCDHMFGTRFRKCMLQLGRENLLKYYTMCNTVMCRETGDMEQWKNDACDVIDALAHECEIIGIKVSWREVTKCYKKCPENMTFKHNVSVCRITCDNYNTQIKCPTDETESRCDCRDGYVLSKETCVPVQECGCIYQDNFLEVGQTVTLFGCQMMAVCVRDKFGWSNIEYHELPGCSPRESCHLVNESYECIVHCGGEVCHENATCEENKCRCHVGLYGDGVTTCRSTLGVCSCLVSGLSRYRTYDGQMIHYLSTCPVELTTTAGQSDDTKLSVYSTTLFSNELMLSFGTRRYRTANVTINGLNIYMDTSGKVYVNDVKIALPFKDNEINVSISYTAGWITICSEDGVTVSYDSKHRIKMFLPKEYRGKLNGICGNCNGVHDELKTRHGVTTTNSEIIGNSYSLNGSHSCGPVSIKKCERGVKRCELMRSGMFADCHPYLDDGLVQSYYDSCMHMTCAFRSYTDYMDKLTCAALESLDTECMSRGYIVEWRSQRLCPVSCCRPMMYNQHVNETEESCVPSLEVCPIRPVDGCTCAEGYVLDNNKCVLPRDCGCWYNNSLYIQLGETIHLPGCNTMVQCRKIATGKRNLVITNLPDGCGNNSMCILKDHKYQCICEEGFARNKNDTFCLKIPECGDQPVDVVFVVDVSGSINVTGLNSTKHFLTHFINSTNIGKNNMQISILLFNDKPHSLFQLNRYTEKKQMLDAVYKIGPPEGTTYLGRALVFVALVSLQEKMGAREHVNRAVVILTDGVLHDAERAERWGALLRRQKKAELFAIGVGEADPAQLQRLTRNRNNVFYVREYVQLNGIMDILLQSVCM